MNKLQVLTDNDIHWTIESYYGIGMTFFLGDKFNGVANYKSFYDFNEGVEWLWQEAKKKNPDNDCFAENRY